MAEAVIDRWAENRQSSRPLVDFSAEKRIAASFDVAEGEVVSIDGPSGCRKTILLRMLADHQFVGERNLVQLPALSAGGNHSSYDWSDKPGHVTSAIAHGDVGK